MKEREKEVNIWCDRGTSMRVMLEIPAEFKAERIEKESGRRRTGGEAHG